MSDARPPNHALATANGGVCLMVFHVPQCGLEWLPEMPFAECAASLRGLGIAADLAHAELAHGDGAATDDAEEQLFAWLRACQPKVIVFDQLPAAHLPQRFKRELGALLIDTDPWGHLRDAKADFLVHDAVLHGDCLLELCRCATLGLGVAAIANVSVLHGDQFVATPAGRTAPAPLFGRDYLRRAEHAFIPRGFVPHRWQRALQTSTGCPYTFDPSQNPEFCNIALADDAKRGGCSFCSMGGHYRSFGNSDAVQYLADKIALIGRREPEVTEIFVTDQMPLRFVDALAEQIVQRGANVRLLVSARADWIVQKADALRRAARTLAAAGSSLGLYLCGFETFSPHLARVYNKSARPELWQEQCTEAIQLLFELRRQHGEQFVVRQGALSFIVHSPWTTLQDLRVDADHMQGLGIGALSAEAPCSELRLYDNVALTAKARHEGLLADEHLHGHKIGYAQVLPWRFADRRAARVHAIVNGLAELLPARETATLLAAAVDLVEREGQGAAEISVELLRQGLQKLLAATAQFALFEADDCPVEVGHGCNNGCIGCVSRHLLPAPIEAERIAAQLLDSGRTPRRVILAGREPTLLADLPKLVQLLHQADVADIAVLSNARRFAVSAYGLACARAGLRRVVFKIAGPDPAVHDAYARVDGAFGQMTKGCRNLQALGQVRLEALATVHGGNWRQFGQTVAAAEQLGARKLRVWPALATLPLERLAEVAAVLSAV